MKTLMVVVHMSVGGRSVNGSNKMTQGDGKKGGIL